MKNAELKERKADLMQLTRSSFVRVFALHKSPPLSGMLYVFTNLTL